MDCHGCKLVNIPQPPECSASLERNHQRSAGSACSCRAVYQQHPGSTPAAPRRRTSAPPSRALIRHVGPALFPFWSHAFSHKPSTGTPARCARYTTCPPLVAVGHGHCDGGIGLSARRTQQRLLDRQSARRVRCNAHAYLAIPVGEPLASGCARRARAPRIGAFRQDAAGGMIGALPADGTGQPRLNEGGLPHSCSRAARRPAPH